MQTTTPSCVRATNDLAGRVAVVTGATGGLGLATTRALAARGARVIMAVRNTAKAAEAREALLREDPGLRLEVRGLDLADLASVRDFAAGLVRDEARIDLLINNAGIAQAPLTLTPEGVDLQFGANHLGHFALTGLLLGRLSQSGHGRVVTVSSMMIRKARLQLDQLGGPPARIGYRWMDAYARSKLANALFGFELDRRLRAAGSTVTSVVSHPGLAATAMHDVSGALGLLIAVVSKLFAKTPEVAARTQVVAATAPGVKGGAFIGPPRRRHGMPAEDDPGQPALNRDDARALWALSERLTGVIYAL